jgi:hypothetical protein
MSKRATAITAGLALYIALVLAFYGLHRLAFGAGGGPYPIWYSVGELIFNAAKAVAPGLLVGWLCRMRAVGIGGAVGVAGGLIEVVLLGALTGIPFTEVPGRMAVAAIFTAITSGLTNAVGAAAGAFFGQHAKPSNPLMQPTGQERPAAD